MDMENFLVDKFDKADIIRGDNVAIEPDYCNFVNSAAALEMLHKHIHGEDTIAVHCDVDVDGILTGYEMFKLFSWFGTIRRTGFIINKEKVHGISEKHVEYFKTHKAGLLVILDSSSNEIELIKQMNCDVLVIDHHEILHSELSGKTAGGQYLIVSNMVSCEDTTGLNRLISRSNIIVDKYVMEKRMSCGLVVYELLRLYQLAYSTGNLAEEALLYQCAGVTLFTDVIPLCTSRNQYYIEKTVHNMNIEPTLKIMLKEISRYHSGLDKTFINFSLAPKINKAIRAGASQEALDIVLNSPGRIKELDKYKELQERATENLMEGVVSGLSKSDKFTMKDITGTVINKNYRGVIAAKLCDETKKNTIVCVRNSLTGLLEGSFRGRYSECDYRQFFEQTYPGIYAQGHASAFGFKATNEQLEFLMNSLDSIEPKDTRTFYLTAGDMPDKYKGEHHIEDMTLFKRQRGLLKLAMSNSKLSSEESINIMVLNPCDLQADRKGKVYYYDILGLKCMSFEELRTEWLSIYVEYANDINIYVKNVKV